MKLNFDWKDLLMGIQYLFVASGATILVPILTGIPVSACLFSAGVGTLIFHFVTKRKVPILLSSSFAFIAPIIAVSESFGQSYAFGAIFLAGLVYLLFALIIYIVGIERVLKLFPTTVTATMVILIGLILAPVAIDGASSNWFIALITLAIGIFVKVFWEKQLLGSLSVILAIIGGTVIAAIGGLVDFSMQVAFVSFPDFTLPQFSWGAISIIVPISIVTFLEHFADVSAVSKVVDQDFLEDPGVHRTLMGDGIATALAGLIGGCPNTTYSENIGALEMTGVKKPVTLRITAVLLIALAFFPGLAMMIHSIPGAVVGGISILLFGMIASNGVRSLSKVDFSDFKNMIIVSAMLIIGVGGTVIDIFGVQFSSLAVAALMGVILNLVFNFKSIFNKV